MPTIKAPMAENEMNMLSDVKYLMNDTYNDTRNINRPNEEMQTKVSVIAPKFIKLKGKTTQEYFTDQPKDENSPIYIKDSNTVPFEVKNIPKDVEVNVELKINSADSTSILSCGKCIGPLIQVDLNDELHLVKTITNTKYNLYQLDTDVKVDVKFLCLNSHHSRQGTYYKLIFTAQKDENIKEIGNFVVKVCAIPGRDWNNYKNPKKRRSAQTEDTQFDDLELPSDSSDGEMGIFVIPSSKKAKKEILDVIKSCNGKAYPVKISEKCIT